MRRRRREWWLAPVVFLATVPGPGARGEDPALPPALEEPPGAAAATPAPRTPKPAATEPAPTQAEDPVERGLPINLATALQLAGARPLDIAAATAQVEQSLALLLQAKALWIPNLNGGVDYLRHDGVLQNLFTGQMVRQGRQSLFVGGGPNLYVGLADAIYAPLAARRVVASRQADLQAARNDALESVAQAYFELQAARGRLVGTLESGVRARRLVAYAEGLAPALIAPLEINRAKTELQSLRQTQQVAIQDWKVASARLAEILLLEPGTLLEPVEPPFLQITLIRCGPSADELMPVAVNNRPEIASRNELVVAATMLLRREKTRPFLPNLIITSGATNTGLLAAGNNAGGPNQFLNQNGSRVDLEVAAVWQLQNLGVGNAGLIRQRRAERELASVELTRTVFRVKAEVAQSLARLQTARVRVGQTEEGLRQAIESADKNFIGLRETTRPAGSLLRLVIRPQEVVAAIMALNVAYQEYSDAVNLANRAQFELYRALGQPAQWVTSQPPLVTPPAAQPSGTTAPRSPARGAAAGGPGGPRRGR